MVDKQVKVRLVMDGGRVVETQLQGIGTNGKAAMDGLGKASKNMRYNIQNAAYQVQDFFVQVGAGTSASRALSQQLPQLLGSFGLIGVLAGTAAALIIPLASSLFSMGEKSVSAADQVKTLTEAVAALSAANQAANVGGDALFVQYGAGADQAKEVLEIERQMAKVRAERALSDASRAIGSGAVDVGPQTATMGEDLARARVEYELLSAEIAAFGDIKSESDQRAWQALEQRRVELDAIFSATQNYRNEMIGFADGLGLVFEGNEVALQNINNAMAELAAANTIEGQAAAAAVLRQALVEASDGGKLLNKEGKSLLDNLSDAELAALALSRVDIASGISSASAEAVALSRNLGISLDLAQRIAAMGPQGLGEGPAPTGGRGDPRTMGGSFLDWQTRDATEFNRTWKPPKVDVGGGAGAGGGTSPAQQEQNDLLREAEKLYSQTRTDAEKYTEEVSRLDEMLKAGVIDQDLYNRGLAAAAEQYGKATGAAGFFKEMNIDVKKTLIDLAVDGSSALDGLIDKLKRAAAEALLFGTGPIAGLFGMSAGGIFGDGFTGVAAGALAGGGPVARGKAYRVGEQGPEWFVPNANGAIVPSDVGRDIKRDNAAADAASSGGGSSRVVVSLDSGLVGSILDQAADRAVQIVQQALGTYDKHVMPNSVRAMQANARRV